MQSSPVIIVVVMSSNSAKSFYSLLCAETSTNDLPDGINYTADDPSVFAEISSLSGL